MRPTDKIEKYIKNTKVKTNPAVNQHVLNDLLDQLPEASAKQSAGPNIWRIVMHTKTFKLSIAAMIVIAGMLIVHYLGAPIDVASVAWGQVVEQMNNYTRYKCRQQVVRSEGPQMPAMQIYHLNLSQRRQETEDGMIHIIDMRGNDPVTVELDPAAKKATVTILVNFGPKKDPDIIEMVKKFDQESTERLGTKKVNGKTLYGFRHLPNPNNDFTVWVDPETRLPVEIELKHIFDGQLRQTLLMDEFEFDFQLDPSAFSTEVPEGYEVKTIIQDYTPVETKQITAEDLRSGLNHTAYTVKQRPWMQNITLMQMTNPTMQSGKTFMIGIIADDGNRIVINQSNMHHDYKEAIMEWVVKQDLVLETPAGIKVYGHPNSAIAADLYLRNFAVQYPEFMNLKDLSEEKFTRMIVMPDGAIMDLSVNRQITAERLQELVESLIPVEAD